MADPELFLITEFHCSLHIETIIFNFSIKSRWYNQFSLRSLNPFLFPMILLHNLKS